MVCFYHSSQRRHTITSVFNRMKSGRFLRTSYEFFTEFESGGLQIRALPSQPNILLSGGIQQMQDETVCLSVDELFVLIDSFAPDGKRSTINFMEYKIVRENKYKIRTANKVIKRIALRATNHPPGTPIKPARLTIIQTMAHANFDKINLCGIL